MNVIEELKKAKKGETQSYEKIVVYYKQYVFHIMNKYNIVDKEECFDIISQRIMKAIWLFNVEK